MREGSRSGCLVVKKRRSVAVEGSESGREDLAVFNGGGVVAVRNEVLDLGEGEEGVGGVRRRGRFLPTEIVKKRGRMCDLDCSEDDDELDESSMEEEEEEDLDDDDGAANGAFVRSDVVGSSVKVPNGKCRDVGTECSGSIRLRTKEGFNFGRKFAFSAGQDKRTDLMDAQEFEVREGGSSHLDGSMREKFGNSYSQPIRVQGKNGVLKVMLGGKNTLGASDKNYNHREARVPRKASMGTKAFNWEGEAPLSPTLWLEPKFHGRPRSAVVRKNKENSKGDLSGYWGSRNNKPGTSNNSLLMGLKSVAISVSEKEKKNKGKNCLTSKAVVSIGGKEREVRRGNATEKQLLRERIRRLLFDAGWTIDFRPRKNRNYQDAVYINPSGTEYWSIIKAYDALKSHYDDGILDYRDGIGSSFIPIPEEALSQLTRQTRKKMEREKITKQKGHKRLKSSENEFRKKQAKARMGCSVNGKELNYFTRKDGKSLKFRIKDNNSIVLNNKKSYELSDDSGFREGESLLQLEDVSSGTLGKEKTESSRINALGRKHKKQTGRGLLIRSSKKGVHSGDDDFVPYSGKRTILSWLIDMGTIPMSGKVQYKNKRRTRTLLEGWITKDGIHCGCCSKILTVSKFEIHAGSKLRQPFQYIFLEDGASLLQSHIDAWNKQEKRESSGFCLVDCDCADPNDDTCTLCGDGGDLICCDGCPSTFHQSCLNIPMLPVGDWHCPNCSCKFCQGIGGTTGQGKDAALSLLTCSLCEEKYHQLCCQDIETRPVDPSASTSFCDRSCKKIFQKLQKLLGVKQELDAGFSWTLIQRSNLDSDTSDHSLAQKAECNSRLAVALSVMDECFLPIIDRRSGINLINGVLYNCGSNFHRLNFSGFYTVVLERGDEIVSAASIRIHGSKLAEMPFIGTRHIYRRQGMCRRLLNAIESVGFMGFVLSAVVALCSLNVEKLVIPAISDLMDTWTKVFNFKPLEESHMQEIRSMNMLVFPATGLLQKQLLMDNSTGENMAVELESNCRSVTKNTTESEIGSPKGIHCSDEGAIHHPQGINNEIVLTETSAHGLGGSTFDDISNKLSNHELIFHATGKDAASDVKLLPNSRGPCDDELKVENGHMPSSSSASKFLSFEEDVVKKNVETSDGDSEFHSAESSLQNWTTKNSNYLDASRGCNLQSTNWNILQSNSDMPRHEVRGAELNTDEVRHFVSDASVCEEHASGACAEIMDQDSCELEFEDIAILPDEVQRDKDCVGCLPDGIAQPEGATPVNSSQCSGHNDLFQDTERADDLHRVSNYMSGSTIKTMVHHNKSCMSHHVQKCALTNASEPGTFQAEGEASNGEYLFQVTREDASEFTLKVEALEGESLYDALTVTVPSGEFESCQMLPNNYNTYADLTFLPASEADYQNINNLVADSDVAFSDGSSLHDLKSLMADEDPVISNLVLAVENHLDYSGCINCKISDVQLLKMFLDVLLIRRNCCYCFGEENCACTLEAGKMSRSSLLTLGEYTSTAVSWRPVWSL
ncbi:hypothetical protein Sjap_006551 [Stephania japonica]|uniref:PHD-type domain-containing protein n=1 Tax=Stephania japonica TaxID=461633 RepID=A0AAP0PJ10_9MAGN